MKTPRLVLLTLVLTLLGCDDDPVPGDGGTQPGIDAQVARDAAPGVDAAHHDPDAGDGPSVSVEHQRELRGAWVSSVWNGSWPSRTGLSESASRAEITTILDTLQALRMNSVFVQVRPESDALYPSELDPWSRWLTGTIGSDPGWDPLQVWIEEGHARGIEVHAWLNPYRAATSTTVARPANHIANRYPQHAITWGSGILMDPGAPEVRAHIVAVVRDLVARYDVDGIHFDDYFYPYPTEAIPRPGQVFPDDDTYAAHGGGLSRDDWRRDNVNTMVREVHEAIEAERDDVRFGISPFGIYRPGMPPGIAGTDAYAILYCDAPHWLAEGWVDYVAPQLYWPSTRPQQPFGPLIEWWAALPRDPGRSILAGIKLSDLGADEWPAEEIGIELDLTRAQAPNGARGFIAFTTKQLVADTQGIRSVFEAANPTAVQTPVLASAVDARIGLPSVRLEGAEVVLDPPAGVHLRAYAVYAQPSGEFVRLVHAAGSTRITLSAGSYAISAIDRRGVESGGVEIDIP